MKRKGYFIGGLTIFLLLAAGMAKLLSVCIYKKADKAYLKKCEECTKLHGYYNTLISWMGLKQNGGLITDYFSKGDSVAVYGMGKIGELLCRELIGGGVNVLYGIDGNSSGENIATGLHVYSAGQDKLPEADYIVISISYLSDSIVPELEKKCSGQIVTIDEIFEAVYQ